MLSTIANVTAIMRNLSIIAAIAAAVVAIVWVVRVGSGLSLGDLASKLLVRAPMKASATPEHEQGENKFGPPLTDVPQFPVPQLPQGYPDFKDLAELSEPQPGTQ